MVDPDTTTEQDTVSEETTTNNADNEYERQRQERILANKRKIEELGLKASAEEMQQGGEKPKKPRVPKAPKVDIDPADLRKSAREVKKVTYNEEEFFNDLPALRPKPVLRKLDEAEVEALRQKNGVGLPNLDEFLDEEAKKAKRGPQDSGKGVRIQGGKVYDSKFGVTCHWCRQKTLEENVTCTHPNCGKGKRMPTSFCKNCLKNRHGEDYAVARASGSWVCPPCRGNCGKGCVICCNCGPCRKKAGLEPTHQVLKCAKEVGFDNVHDYLVHLVTKESQDKLRQRKVVFAWGAWLKGDSAEALEGAGASGSGSGGEDATQPEAPASPRAGEGAGAGAAAAPRTTRTRATAGAGAGAGPSMAVEPAAAAVDAAKAAPRRRPAGAAAGGGRRRKGGEEKEVHDSEAEKAEAGPATAVAEATAQPAKQQQQPPAKKGRGRGRKGAAATADDAAATEAAAPAAATAASSEDADDSGVHELRRQRQPSDGGSEEEVGGRAGSCGGSADEQPEQANPPPEKLSRKQRMLLKLGLGAEAVAAC